MYVNRLTNYHLNDRSLWLPARQHLKYALVLFFAWLCCDANTARAMHRTIQDRVVTYAFPNDEATSVAININKRLESPNAPEEWVAVVSLARTQHGLADFDTTASSTVQNVASAVYDALADFSSLNPQASIVHIYCSSRLTSDTITSFGKWLDSANCGGGETVTIRCLDDRVNAYTFEPLRTEIDRTLMPLQLKISNVECAQAEKSRGVSMSANEYADYLKREHNFYYMLIDQIE